MILKLADLIIEVKSRYRYTYDMCYEYLYDGDRPVDFTVFATLEQIENERQRTPEFGDDILENTCIYRNICNQILKYDAVFIHSAAICVDDMAYLFSANSGTGKTTHMNLWLEKFGERAYVINGDKPILRVVDDELYVYGTPWCGKEGINKNVRIRVGAMYILERALENKIRKADKKEALMFTLTQTTHPKDKKLYELMFSNIGNVLDRTPVFVLGCNMDIEACEVAYSAVMELIQKDIK